MEDVHKRTLRVIFNEYEKNYNHFLAEHNEISIFQKHLQFLVTEVFTSTNKLNLQFMWCFCDNHEIPYNLRCGSAVNLPVNLHNKIRKKFTWFLRLNVLEYNTKKCKTFQDGTRIYEKVEETLDTFAIVLHVAF